jgi:integrase
VAELLRTCGRRSGEYLFPGDSEPERVDYVSNLFRAWAKKLKEPRWHPHALRHTFGSALAARGVSATVIGSLLGHQAGTSITSWYLTPGEDERRAAMESLWEG